MSDEVTLGPEGLTGRFASDGTERALAAEQMLASVQSSLFGSGDTIEIGRFNVLKRLGEGGMGVVLKAYDPQLERVIALKVLKAGPGDASQERLLAEARAMAKVRHANLVTVFETGIHAGEVFVAMEFVDGLTLRGWTEKHATHWRDVLSAYVPAAQGLAAIHAAGLTHRDFKPDNVLIDGEKRVQVTDFGLAQTTRERPNVDEQASLNSLGGGERTLESTALAGSPGYLAPEQWHGEVADALSDQFSLCVSIYEALYGERPFHADSVPELSMAVTEGRRAPKPSPRVSSVPRWLDRIIDRGLSLDPAERFLSVDALLKEVERCRRRPTKYLVIAAALGGSVATAAALGFGDEEPDPCATAAQSVATLWSEAGREELRQTFLGTEDLLAEYTWARVEPKLDAYAQSIQTLRVEACLSTRVRGEASEEALDIRVSCLDRRAREFDALLDVFGDAGSQTVLQAVAATEGLAAPESCRDVETARLAVHLPEEPALRKKVDDFHEHLDTLAALLSAGKFADAASSADTLIEEAEEIGFEPTIAEAVYYRGSIASKLGQTKKADELLRRSFNEGLATGQDEIVAWSAILQVHLQGEIARDAAQSEFWEGTARAMVRRGTGDAMVKGSLLNNLAGAAFRAGDLDKARLHFTEAVQYYDRSGRGASVRAGQARSNLASVYRRQGDYESALRELSKAKRILTVAVGSDHPDIAPIHNGLGAIQLETGNFDAAEAEFLRSLEIKQQRLEPTDPSVGHPYNNIGEVFAARGDHDEAISWFTKALTLWEATIGPKHPLVGHVLTQRGLSRLASAQLADAASDLQRALAIREQLPDPAAKSEARFGLARAIEGDAEKARALAEQALAELPPEHPRRKIIKAWLEKAPGQAPQTTTE